MQFSNTVCTYTSCFFYIFIYNIKITYWIVSFWKLSKAFENLESLLKKAFENLSINEKIDLLNTTLLNIFRNYIPNKILKCSYRDPLWLTKLVKSKLKERSKITIEFYRKDQDPTVFIELNKISSECLNLTKEK